MNLLSEMLHFIGNMLKYNEKGVDSERNQPENLESNGDSIASKDSPFIMVAKLWIE
jgi:hypothetical protein